MRIVFFSRVPERKALDVVEFYTQDMNAIRKIDPEMKVSISYREIDWKADLIFIWWWTYALYPVIRARLTGKKVIITGTFNYRCPGSPVDYFRRPWYQRLLIKMAMRWAHLNILVSRHEYDQILQDWKFRNLAYSPHGVETEKYLPGNKREENLLFTMCWTGKLNLKRKCLPEVIQAMTHICRIRPEAKLVIGGRKGDGHKEVEYMVEAEGLKDNIILLGEISEETKISYYQQCNLYLQPSRYEGFGLAIAEAMSCGAAVLSSDAGEVGNLVGDCGIILDSCEPEAIAKTVIKALEDRDGTSALGQKASVRIREQFPVERRENDIIQYIRQFA